MGSGSNPKSVYAIDLDGDNDMDILAAFQGSGHIIWYENNGTEDFTSNIIANKYNQDLIVKIYNENN